MALFSGQKKMKEKYAERIPPGQTPTEKWPVLHFGEVPRSDLAAWDFRVFGEVEEELRFGYEEFTALPAVEVACDIHCVTHWSRMDNRFYGVAFGELMKRVKPREGAAFVVIHCEEGYTTNLPLAACMEDDVVWAWKHDGEDLTPEHGWPLRLVVPGRYFWKSAKWARGVEFASVDKPGFWETRGYHNEADPFAQQRYSH